MNREVALLELTTAHAVALRMRDAGAGDDDIGRALAIPVQAVPPLLLLAENKLAALLSEPPR